jgi:predicted enzyme related to lactoylglutathione lyase
MAEASTATTDRPVWIDLASSDAAASRGFYSRLFGWDLIVSDDPQYGGYATAKIAGRDVAGIGPLQSPEAPTAWSLYIGTSDVDALAREVTAAGGIVVAPPFDVGDQGRMAVFQDPSGAFISAWQSTQMSGFGTSGPNTFGWAELSARGFEKAARFYGQVFGWTTRTSDADGQPYTEFLLDGESIAGGMEMDAAVPAGVPSYWMPYINVDDVDASFRKALDAGGREMVAPAEYPGGRFAIVSDPQGAAFGLLKPAEA